MFVICYNEIKLAGSDVEAIKDGAFACGLTLDSIEQTDREVLTAWDGKMYFKGEEPEKPEPTKEEQQKARQEAYKAEVDPITCHIQRLSDEEQTPEVIAEIASLVEERKAKVAEIKARYPYVSEVSFD